MFLIWINIIIIFSFFLSFTNVLQFDSVEATTPNNEYTVNNTHSFVNDVGQIGGASQYFMASFDVENLFTNIPLNETIDICLKILFTDPTSLIIGLPRKLFKTLMKLSVLNSIFTFDGKYFINKLMFGNGPATRSDVRKLVYVLSWIHLALRLPCRIPPSFL